MVRGLHHESATHSEYTNEPMINISTTLATSAQDGIRLDYFCRIGVSSRRQEARFEGELYSLSTNEIWGFSKQCLVFRAKTPPEDGSALG